MAIWSSRHSVLPQRGTGICASVNARDLVIYTHIGTVESRRGTSVGGPVSNMLLSGGGLTVRSKQDIYVFEYCFGLLYLFVCYLFVYFMLIVNPVLANCFNQFSHLLPRRTPRLVAFVLPGQCLS